MFVVWLVGGLVLVRMVSMHATVGLSGRMIAAYLAGGTVLAGVLSGLVHLSRRWFDRSFNAEETEEPDDPSCQRNHQ